MALVLFFKAYIHGHYRINKKTGARAWVDSYTDKRPERHRASFDNDAHRVTHFEHHMALGRQREALHAFHDLDHAGAHKLARHLGLAGDEAHGDKKGLMESIHARLGERQKALQASKGREAVEAEKAKRTRSAPKSAADQLHEHAMHDIAKEYKAAAARWGLYAGKQADGAYNPSLANPKLRQETEREMDTHAHRFARLAEKKGIPDSVREQHGKLVDHLLHHHERVSSSVDIPDRVKDRLRSTTGAAHRYADSLDRARQTDGKFGGHRYAGEYLSGPNGTQDRKEMDDSAASLEKMLDSIKDPAKRKAARAYVDQHMPHPDRLKLHPEEQAWLDEAKEVRAERKPASPGRPKPPRDTAPIVQKLSPGHELHLDDGAVYTITGSMKMRDRYLYTAVRKSDGKKVSLARDDVLEAQRDGSMVVKMPDQAWLDEAKQKKPAARTSGKRPTSSTINPATLDSALVAKHGKVGAAKITADALAHYNADQHGSMSYGEHVAQSERSYVDKAKAPKPAPDATELLMERNGYQWGMAKVPHPSGNGDTGYGLKMRKVGAKEWEPETYGYMGNKDRLLEHVASGRSSLGREINPEHIRHAGLLKQHERVQAQRKDRAEAEARNSQEARDRENEANRRHAAIAEHMAGVKRTRGKARVPLSNGDTREVSGWQHGDFIVHKRLPSSTRRRDDTADWTVTHTPTGAAVRHTHTAESGRELAYRMHLAGTGKWDGTTESLKPGGNFHALLGKPLTDYVERNEIKGGEPAKESGSEKAAKPAAKDKPETAYDLGSGANVSEYRVGRKRDVGVKVRRYDNGKYKVQVTHEGIRTTSKELHHPIDVMQHLAERLGPGMNTLPYAEVRKKLKHHAGVDIINF